jgi:hypothetical protein
MSAAEELREAARLMRERAYGATSGPWSVVPDVDGGSRSHVVSDFITTRYASKDPTVAVCASPQYGDTERAEWGQTDDAVHIASWGPEVADLVAVWLDAEAEHIASHDCEAHCEPDGCAESTAALAVARAYLGTT